jgi:RNA polymerase sigma factor (sigma-70 family)
MSTYRSSATTPPWARIRDALVTCADRIVADPDEAEDVAHEVLTRLVAPGNQHGNWLPRDFIAYEKRAVLNEVRDRARATSRSLASEPAWIARRQAAQPDQLLDAKRLEERFIRAMTGLPPRAAVCYFEVEILGFRTDEVAECHGVTRKAVEMRLAFGRRRIREEVLKHRESPAPVVQG